MVTIPYRLAARYQLMKADVAAVFAAIVNEINGGLMSARNFSRTMRLPNAKKVEQYGVFPVEVRFDPSVVGTKTYHVAIPGPGCGLDEAVSLTVTHFTVHIPASAGALAGTVKLYRNDATGALVQIGGTVTIVGGTTTYTVALTSAPAGTKDTRLRLDVQITAGAGIAFDGVALVWMKAKHVR